MHLIIMLPALWRIQCPPVEAFCQSERHEATPFRKGFPGDRRVTAHQMILARRRFCLPG